MTRQLLFVCAAACAAHAGALTGRVFDPSGAVVPGATVKIRKDTTVLASAPSGQDGAFQFTVPAGLYAVEVLAPGFQTYSRTERVSDKAPASVPVWLNLGQISETISVDAKGTPAPAPPTRIRVGGNVQPARLLAQPRAVYPEEARAKGVAGTVVLRTVILMDGTVADPREAGSADPLLAAAAKDAVKKWRYSPTLLNGQPVETVTTVSVQFDLHP